MTSTILFDLDETLYPYTQFIIGGFKSAAKFAYGKLNINKDKFYRTCLAVWQAEGNSGSIFNQVAAKLKLSYSVIPDFIAAFRNQEPKIRLYPDAQKFIDSVYGKIKLGLITDGLEEVQKRKIAALNINQYFDTIICSDSLGRHNWKPSPLPYLKALNDLGVIPSQEVIYIGDNPHKDFFSAKKLGLNTIRLKRGQFRHDIVAPEWEADAEFWSFSELLEAL